MVITRELKHKLLVSFTGKQSITCGCWCEERQELSVGVSDNKIYTYNLRPSLSSTSEDDGDVEMSGGRGGGTLVPPLSNEGDGSNNNNNNNNVVTSSSSSSSSTSYRLPLLLTLSLQKSHFPVEHKYTRETSMVTNIALSPHSSQTLLITTAKNIFLSSLQSSKITHNVAVTDPGDEEFIYDCGFVGSTSMIWLLTQSGKKFYLKVYSFGAAKSDVAYARIAILGAKVKFTNVTCHKEFVYVTDAKRRLKVYKLVTDGDMPSDNGLRAVSGYSCPSPEQFILGVKNDKEYISDGVKGSFVYVADDGNLRDGGVSLVAIVGATVVFFGRHDEKRSQRTVKQFGSLIDDVGVVNKNKLYAAGEATRNV